ncbi:MAG: hypothetical protein QOC68_4518, partial [Solirubrobacteraceae bacterium]|nr:hypothetical protein [Solirubrobacteraceae bacterium]
PGGLRDALAETLGDPHLELLHAHGNGWIDGRGLARRPEGAAVTELTRDGRAVAVLLHRPGLLDDARLVRELERTAGLALENDQLHGELEAQLAQLRDSRAETVAVGDAERRRLERDLHDGAQQALAGLAMSFGLARADAVEPLREQRLGVAQDAVRGALAELRALAQRISPPALSEAGLATALGVLAEWAPNLEIARVPRQRFNPTVESAAYFAVAGLARTIRGRIVVDARVEGASLRLEVLAAEAPSSLVDIEDRVAALDGDLLAEAASDGATLLRITLPCAS